MAIDITDLLILRKAGTPKQRKQAEYLLPIRKNGNRILCTLLLSNVASNSLVTVFLNNLINSGWATFVLSTISLCIIGEVVPQAVFNRHGFLLASKSIMFIKFMLIITAPFAYPIGLILDKILGAEAGDKKKFLTNKIKFFHLS
jgi:metal transporter CNNM